ncbi:TetR/AcrR family transcriptional regulator [Amycolatopsis saalfeldensis]|uniref:DNA-binding transcriptional regulator YbjK n=1 Tax=Amycolatopsis saalfeldensis TaxID=394193 RepID=A0A1H8YLU3_9PSEU|nr:TetR/AcrR family transcriptional regulator C-terminal domain-containing protein [Amycolatopsis saalfeldensis]SEP53129.1 DNA-binding transcriptional regulator YbjK [Amycolatopsis saalfeldensis]
MPGARQGKQQPKAGGARPRRPRDSLSREAILEAAEKIALRDGLGGLTFQAIGAELDAHPTSMYRHFRDKDDLLLELVDGLRARSYGGTVTATDDWRHDLRTISQRVREHYVRYAPFAQEMVMRTTRRPVEFSNVEFTLDALRRAGLDDEEAVVVQRAFGNFVRAVASLEAAFLALEPEVRKRDELAWQVEYRQLDAGQYPVIADCADLLPNLGSPVAFDTGLEMMLDSIELRAQKSLQRKGIGEGVEQAGDQRRADGE